MRNGKAENICIAASAGGHLTEVMQLKEAWSGKKHFFITDKRINSIDLARKENVYFITPARRNPIKLLVSIFQTAKIFIKEKPSAIVSTGAETAFPSIIIGALLGKRVIYVETFARINSPSLTGRLVYPFVRDFFVQWPQSKKFFPKARYVGGVFE